MRPEEFAKGMMTLSVAYPNFNSDKTTTEIWYSFFEDIRADSFAAAIKSHIRKSPFPPKINELLDQCEEQGGIIQNETLKYMYDSGYFHTPDLGDAHALKNYQKSLAWVERNVIPEWLKIDMRDYYKLKLEQKQQIKLEE